MAAAAVEGVVVGAVELEVPAGAEVMDVVGAEVSAVLDVVVSETLVCVDWCVSLVVVVGGEVDVSVSSEVVAVEVCDVPELWPLGSSWWLQQTKSLPPGQAATISD